MKRFLTWLGKHKTSLMILGSLLLLLMVYYLSITYSINTTACKIVICLYALFVLAMLLWYKGSKNLIALIFILGVLMRMVYILDTDIRTREHDVGELYGVGHLGYMNILYETHQLPKEVGGQFYHPPMWHLLGAGWLELNELCHIDAERAAEGIQVLTALLSAWMILIVDKIAIRLNLKDKYRYWVDLLVAVHPALLILSGSINNDCLLLFFELLIFLWILRWNEDDSWLNTIVLAFITGFCVMTKLNGALMAVPILFVFIKKLIIIIKNHWKGFKKYALQMFHFGIISLPIGLWYQVRNIIVFGKNSIPQPPDWYNVEKFGIVNRFLSFNFQEAFRIEFNVQLHNLWASIVRISTFGEDGSLMKIPILAYFMLVLNIFLIAISLFAMIKYCFSKEKNIGFGLLAVTWLTNMVAMVCFNVKYPFVCTMDFRYIFICLVVGVFFLFEFLQRTTKKWISIPILAICYSFVLLSVGLIFCY